MGAVLVSGLAGAVPSRKARPESIPERVPLTVGGPNCKRKRCKRQGSPGGRPHRTGPRRHRVDRPGGGEAWKLPPTTFAGFRGGADELWIPGPTVQNRAYLAVLRTTREARMDSPDDLLTTAEVAQIMRSPVSTLRYWRHLGTGPHSFRLGRRVVYRRADVTAWLLEQAAAGRAERAG